MSIRFSYTPHHRQIVQKAAFWLVFALFLAQNTSAQPDSLLRPRGTVRIENFSFEGLKKTRKSLIFRELEYGIGDTFPAEQLEEVIERNRLRILNLGIFSFAEILVDCIDPNGSVDLRLRVRESWYWYPSPVFELVDRNFNVWWNEFDRSLRRTNVGLDYTQYNFTGHADILNTTLTGGYNERLNLRYRTPWLNRRGTLGLQFGVSYSRAHELAIATIDNKLDFRRDPDRYLIRRFSADGQLSWRPGLLVTHALAVEWRNNRIADTIAAELNPDFFLNGSTTQRHASIVYNYNYDDRDVRQYPTKGWNISVEARRNGLLPGDNFNVSRLRVEVARYTRFSPYYSLETTVVGRTSAPRRQPPYSNNQALGYGTDLVRGYEYYVMDGLDYALLRTSFRSKFFHRMVSFPKPVAKLWKRLQPFEVRAYLSVNNDIGYANDPWYAARNPLSNRPLYGYGIGLDLVLFYNKSFSVAWMRTDLGESGIFIRTRL